LDLGILFGLLSCSFFLIDCGIHVGSCAVDWRLVWLPVDHVDIYWFVVSRWGRILGVNLFLDLIEVLLNVIHRVVPAQE
jgi:hypothetical protein